MRKIKGKGEPGIYRTTVGPPMAFLAIVGQEFKLRKVAGGCSSVPGFPSPSIFSCTIFTLEKFKGPRKGEGEPENEAIYIDQ